MQRRTLLRAAAGAGGTAVLGGLAGCIGESDGDGGGGGDDEDGGQQSPDDGDTPTDEDSDGDDGGDDTDEGGTMADETIRVGPGGDLVFDPVEASVDVGATVEWVWDSDNHTVTPESSPEGSDWEGTGSTTEDAGYTHSHTFETEGQYDYYCEPHRSAGMEATLLVGDVSAEDGMDDDETETPTPTDGDGGGGDDGDDGYY